MKVLVTGCAGFIGFFLAKYLLDRGDEVTGIDNINDYYDVNLKFGRLEELGVKRDEIFYGKRVQSTKYGAFQFLKLDICDKDSLQERFITGDFDVVCNLAAQAGVRYSLINPDLYIDSNIKGFLNILECCRINKTSHLVYASSSSVYGLNEEIPFSVNHKTDNPASIYAATKKANELMAHCYSHLYNLRTTGLRFFTVYGAWSRPDMALFLFTKAIIENEPIKVFNMGKMRRDFTYIDDIINGIIKVIDKPFKNNSQTGSSDSAELKKIPYKILNIGKGSPVRLLDFVSEIEKNLGIIAKKEFLPMQSGDVTETWANVDELKEEFDYAPVVNIAEGVKIFIEWYKAFYIPEQLVESISDK